MKSQQTNKMVYSALFAGLIFLGTQFIKVPLLYGYVHMGDAFILLAAFYIGGGYAVMASAVGSVLADIISGYAVYAPATLAIKMLMAVIVILICRNAKSSRLKVISFAFAAVISEAVMVLGYYLFEALLYGFGSATVSLAGNSLQGAAGVVISVTVFLFVSKAKVFKDF